MNLRAVGLLVSWAVLSLGCVSAKVEWELAMIRKVLMTQQERQEHLTQEVARLQGEAETTKRVQWSEKLCKAGKLGPQISQFIDQVQSQLPNACTAVAMEGAMAFLRTQPYAISYYFPKQPAKEMQMSREEQLIDLLSPQALHPSTRILVMVQPADDSRADEEDAMRLGRELVEKIRAGLPIGQQRALLGPHPLPCRVRPETEKLFRNAMDGRQSHEPKDNVPSIRAFVFRTDC